MNDNKRIRKLIADTIHRLYDNSPFIRICGIELVDFGCGEITMRMKISGDIHVNTHGVAHAGAFVTLADTAFGAVCITKGRRSVTTGLSFNVIGNVKPGETATAVVKAGHLGRTVGSATVDITDDKGRLLCQGIGNLHMTEILEDIPAEWE
jgi:acyl-CoA thioesterase